MKLEIETSKVFTKIRKSDTRIIVNEGSSRSTKTYSICQYIIYRALEKPRKITCCRARLTWIKATALIDFLDILENHFKIFKPKNYNKTESIYTFDNGSVVRFLGLDEVQKIHGLKSDILWLNEAIECEHKDYNQLAIRTTEQIIIDYNPSAEQHWIYDKVIPRDDCTFIKSTYLDNPFLEQSIRSEIERLEPTEANIKMGTADEVAWKIYGLGERAAHQGLIFKHANIVKSLPPMDEWKKCSWGLDFGFTNDPSTLIQVVLAHGELWLKEVFYKKGLVNRKTEKMSGNSIEEELIKHNIPKNAKIWADSAEPKSIQEIQNAGWFNCQPTLKGPDSIISGIQNMLKWKLNITEDSINLIKEKNNYKWKQDRHTGELLNEPVQNYDHCFDASRYCVSMEHRLEINNNKKAFIPSHFEKRPKTLQEKLNYYNKRAEHETSFD